MEVRADRRDLPADGKALSGLTLADLVIRYRDSVCIRKRGGETERIVLAAFLRHPICKRRMTEITPADFARYRDDRLKHVKATTLKRQLGPIRNLFNVARDEWELPIIENPAAKIKFAAKDHRRERRLRPGEEQKLIKAATGCRNRLMVPVIQLALETAMRRGEILGIQREHVDIKRCALLIPETKNGYARTIPLSRKAVVILRRRINPAGSRLFPISANALRLNWHRLKRRAVIDDLRFHDLRHEAISRLFEKGLTIPEVALISGHRDMRMLLRYAHPMRQQIVKKLDVKAARYWISSARRSHRA
jgi:integrase